MGGYALQIWGSIIVHMHLCDKSGTDVPLIEYKIFNKERTITMKLKNNKIFRRIASVVMAAAMAITLLPGTITTVKAAEPSQVSFSLTLQKRANVYSPDTTFTFTAAPAATTPDGYYAAPAAGVAFLNGNNTITTTPDDGNLAATTFIAGTLTLAIDNTKFVDATGNVQPGKYRYEVNQTAGNYEGITYDVVTRYLDVTIGTDGSIVYSELIRNSAKSDKFVNKYGVTGTPTDPEDPDSPDDPDTPGDPDGKVNDLIIKKVVEGNVASTTKKFAFTVKITGTQAAEWYLVTFSDGTASKTVKTNVDENTISFELSHNQTAKVWGLSATDAYVVTETDANTDGYTMSVSEGNASSTVATSDTLVEQNVTIKNTKNETATGIILGYAPYALMIILAGAVAFVFCRKRRNSEF